MPLGGLVLVRVQKRRLRESGQQRHTQQDTNREAHHLRLYHRQVGEVLGRAGVGDSQAGAAILTRFSGQSIGFSRGVST